MLWLVILLGGVAATGGMVWGVIDIADALGDWAALAITGGVALLVGAAAMASITEPKR